MGLYVIMYLAIVFVLELPLAYYEGYVRLHAYGLSNQTIQKWLGDSVTSLAISMVVGFALPGCPICSWRRARSGGGFTRPCSRSRSCSPACWSSRSGSIRLFNQFGPMKDQALEQKILALAGRAGIEGSRVFEVREERRHQGGERLRDGRVCHQEDRSLGYVARQAGRERGAAS